MGETAAAILAGLCTEIIVMRYVTTNTHTAMIRVLTILNPEGIIKYPATAPIKIPVGDAYRNNLRPSFDTSFFICFFVIPMVRSCPN